MDKVHFRVARLNQLQKATSRSKGGKLRAIKQENVLSTSTQSWSMGWLTEEPGSTKDAESDKRKSKIRDHTEPSLRSSSTFQVPFLSFISTVVVEFYYWKSLEGRWHVKLKLVAVGKLPTLQAWGPELDSEYPHYKKAYMVLCAYNLSTGLGRWSPGTCWPAS